MGTYSFLITSFGTGFNSQSGVCNNRQNKEKLSTTELNISQLSFNLTWNKIVCFHDISESCLLIFFKKGLFGTNLTRIHKHIRTIKDLHILDPFYETKE